MTTKPKIRNPKSEIRNPKSEIRNPHSAFCILHSAFKLACTSFLLLFSVFFSSAQDVYPVLSMDVATTPVANHLSLDSLPSLTDSTVFSVEMNVNLFDTLNIQELEVKIGTSSGASDIFSHSFVFDVSGSLGSGLFYLRDAYSIQLGLGNRMQMLNYYSQVRIKKADGSYTDAVLFNR